MSKCLNCYADKSLCDQCSDNPAYANIPRTSHYKDYPVTCKYGMYGCISDPGYIWKHYPKWYKELYGDCDPMNACDEDDDCSCSDCINMNMYDDEDK